MKKRLSKKHRPQRPPEGVITAAKTLFEKENWTGNVIGRPSILASASNPCPKGKIPHDITVLQPDGTTVTKTICL
jgi:hypothetical protein